MMIRTASAAAGLSFLMACAASPTGDIGIHLNQVGFEPGIPVRATVVGAGNNPVPWTIENGAGEVVGEGSTEPFGRDAASGQMVQQVSATVPAGEGYRLKIGGTSSYPFNVESGIYENLAQDALAFFYHQRASTPILERLVGEEWARDAGHAPDIASCPQTDHRGNNWGGCPSSVDVSKGWYDAGDHGKYVENGGIATWALLNDAQRRQGRAEDGVAEIPEAGNGVPDVLDEARWELEFLLAMQVPDGTTLRLPLGEQDGEKLRFTEVNASGMAHHKVGDEAWTGMPTIPAEAPKDRVLAYPSTAATLNLAAVAAQCARLFGPYDTAFAASCRRARYRCFRDRSLADEFYWVASELFATTRERRYLEDMKASEHFLALPTLGQRGIGWPTVEALGTISLLTSGTLGGDLKQDVESRIVAVGDALLAEAAGQGYGVPFDRRYVWGSNGDMANRGMILALAHEATGNEAYRDAVVAIVDYLMGRNPLGFSYIAGYGENALRQPHHRFWMGSTVNGLPLPPPGALAGGPNENPPADEVAAELKKEGCAPMACYRDDLRAYSLNEVAINWNAPLYWIAAYLAE